MKTNIVALADSYKYGHPFQYPGTMVKQFCYMEARNGDTYKNIVISMIQYYLKKYVAKPITKKMVKKAAKRAARHGVPFDIKGWNYIAKLGYLPVKIKAVPEGTVVPTNNVFMTVESTDEEVPWVAGWVETLLLKLWYPITVSTRSKDLKDKMIALLENTCDNPESVIDFMYHNFGDRGSSSVESAAIGGMAHSLIFLGTDNFNSTFVAEKYYNSEMSGYSVNASEHSSTTSWGKDNEFSMVRNHINISRKIKSPVVAAVGDSYDILHFTNVMTSGKYKTSIESATYPTLTIRPDSGDPFKVIPDMLKIMETNKVRYKINSKTLKVFYKYRILWGDGITPDVIMEILKMVINLGYSPENFLFGSGGDLMQKIDRDTCGIAYKCSNIYYRDEKSQVRQREVFKDPVTDKRKRSKKGELELVERNGKLITVKRKEVKPNDKLLLKTVYRNGKITREYNWNTVKSNINK